MTLPRVGQLVRVRHTSDWSRIVEPDSDHWTQRFDCAAMVTAVNDDGTLDLDVYPTGGTQPETRLERVGASGNWDEDGWYAVPPQSGYGGRMYLFENPCQPNVSLGPNLKMEGKA